MNFFLDQSESALWEAVGERNKSFDFADANPDKVISGWKLFVPSDGCRAGLG